jgi:hypothetical protein
MNYRDFNINTSVTPKPWGAREQICIQDIIDTLCVDTVTSVAEPSVGHHHNKVYNLLDTAILTADSKALGMNCVPSPSWNTNAICVIDLKAITNSAILTVDNDLMLLNCAIQKDNSLFYRLNNATAPKLFWATGESFIFSLGEIGAIDSEFDIDDPTSYGVEYTRTGGAIFNTRGGDFDFTILASSSRLALFADATSASIGIGTNLPLLNVGTAAGDFYVDEGTSGLHIKSRQTTIDDTAFLILEGYGEGANGHDYGYDGTKLIMCSSFSSANNKMFLIGSGAHFLHFDSLNDDLTTRKSDILTLDGSTSAVGIGCEPGYKLDIYTLGTIKQVTDIVRIRNWTTGVDMNGTGSAILFDLYGYLSFSVHAGRLSVYCEQDMTHTASTKATTMAFATCSNDVLTDKLWINSAGNMGLGRIPDPYNSALVGFSFGLAAGLITSSSESAFYFASNCYINAAGAYTNIEATDASSFFLAASNGDFCWYSDPPAVIGTYTPTNKMILDIKGNLRLKCTAVDGTAEGCLELANAAAAPAAHTDGHIYMYSTDATVGLDTWSTLALYLEHPIYTDDISPTDWVPIVINGTVKALLLGPLPV